MPSHTHSASHSDFSLKLSDLKTNLNEQDNSNTKASLKLIAGDASDRKFYRYYGQDNGVTAICMEFPKWEGGYGGDPISWLGMYYALEKMNIPVPVVYSVDEKNNCIWTQDLGDDFLAHCLKTKTFDYLNPECKKATELYKQALNLLIQAQYSNAITEYPAMNRFFDHEKLFYELNFFITHFLNNFLELNITPQNNPGLFEDFNHLCKILDKKERVLCHRDYHNRNIMIQNEKLFWIDFQDARMGPHTYDVVSLIRDCYVDITWETRAHLFKHYFELLNEKRVENELSIVTEHEYSHEHMLMGLQRNIKAIGSFGYLATKKNKPSYLNHVKFTLDLLCSEQAIIHDAFNLKELFPNIYSLINDLRVGKHAELLLNKTELKTRAQIED